MAVYVVIEISSDDYKELLGLTMGYVKFRRTWTNFLENLKERSLQSPKLFITDDFNCIANVINAIYPENQVQRCVIHEIRNAVNIAEKNHKLELRRQLKFVFNAPNKTEAYKRFSEYKKIFYQCNKKAVEIIEKSLDEVLIFFDYPKCVRNFIYTNNLCESYFSALWQSVKQKGAFSITLASYYVMCYVSLRASHVNEIQIKSSNFIDIWN